MASAMARPCTVPTVDERVEMALKTGDMTEVLLALHGHIHFVVKKLGQSQVPANTSSSACRLKLPQWFVLEHGGMFQQSVLLRSKSCSEPCRVRLSLFKKNSDAPEIRFGQGWRDFARVNRLGVGDSLIFALKGMSEFEVYVFRGTGTPTSVSSSQVPKSCSTTDSELSREIRDNVATGSAGCSTRPQQQSAVERREGSIQDLCGWNVKRRKIKDEGTTTTPLQNSSSTNLHLLELENVHVPLFKTSPVSHKNILEPIVRQPELRTSFSGNRSAQDDDARQAPGVKKEVKPSQVSLPSFIKRLVEHNVQDSAGNTSGARFEIPLSFVMAYGIQLQALVKLQGIRDESLLRVVTCSSRAMQPPSSLGWGDFVRDNALRKGQELVFSLAAESFFVVREVSEIIVYTKP